MNPELMQAFTIIKPLCDTVMTNPNPEVITALMACLSSLNPELVQEMQHYILFPVFTHIKIKETSNKHEVKRKLLGILKVVLNKSAVYSPGKLIRNHIISLLDLVYDGSRPGMIARVHEELLLDVTECLTSLMLKLDPESRRTVFRDEVRLLARVIFVAVHLAKLEKLRALRLSALTCLTAYMAVHPAFTDRRHNILDKELEASSSDMTASILPGVLAALQDVATSVDNPGHAVVVAALSALHIIVCQIMNDKHVPTKHNVTTEDFANILLEKAKQKNLQQVALKNTKEKVILLRKSPEWYLMAAEKLKVVTMSLMSLQTHDHVKVRLELAVFCGRLLTECSITMQPSIPYVLDVLIALSNDEYPKVSQHCRGRLEAYFSNVSDEARLRTLDSLADSLNGVLQALPRILNNIDSSRKLAALNLLYGYLSILSGTTRHLPLPALCRTLIEAVRHSTDISVLAQLATRDVTSPSLQKTPWVKLKHIDDATTEQRLQAICRLLGDSESADLLVDELLDAFDGCPDDRKEAVWLLNWIGSAPKTDPSVPKRILNKYIEHETWYLPLEVATEPPPPLGSTLDATVYDPAAWDKDSVPGLYEGAVETRYTDISYSTPRLPPARLTDSCATLAEAQSNMVLSCSHTDGLGMCARRLGDEFQSYLLKTLCLVLERVGSKYELLHLAGLKAINDITIACKHGSVAELIQTNADYFTYQVTTRLKKAWNSRSALQILTVVMEYSDSSILNCLYGIVSDVLVQSCDKYHKSELSAYLQVFLTFVDCIHKWFPNEPPKTEEKSSAQGNFDLLDETIEYINKEKESLRLLSNEEFEKETGKSAEEMYREDLEKKTDENELDYDDSVSEEKKPPPQHISLTVTILKRCLNFIPSKRREERLLALQVVNRGLPILRDYEDDLLPLVHLVWAPLVVRFEEMNEPVVLRRAFEVLVTMAALSKDFIRNRTVKEVLPNLFKYLRQSSRDSRLKDVGSAYRSSQAFQVQVDTLRSLPRLVVDLCLDDQFLQDAIGSVAPYLSDKQPKPLQPIPFFKAAKRNISLSAYLSSQAYQVQVDTLGSLPSLVVDLCLDDQFLQNAMKSVTPYLSDKQPKPLQALAVTFFQTMLDYDHGAAWHYLRKLCDNHCDVRPPDLKLPLAPVVGTPFEPTDKSYRTNVYAIFGITTQVSK